MPKTPLQTDPLALGIACASKKQKREECYETQSSQTEISHKTKSDFRSLVDGSDVDAEFEQLESPTVRISSYVLI